MAHRADLIGKRFGRIVVMDFEGILKGHSMWGCLCDCGVGLIAEGYRLSHGQKESCGCMKAGKIKNTFIHGHAKANNFRPASATYRAWCAMKNRCLNPNVSSYPNYGGRGISVCNRWMEFKKFLIDMGDRPNGRSLDRENPWGNYEPGNCSWATQEEQTAHRRSNFLIEGELCLD